jgi:alpha-tubulin suppressor-like RCC1 family protein
LVVALAACRYGFDAHSGGLHGGDDDDGTTDGGVDGNNGTMTMGDALVLPRTVSIAAGAGHTCALTNAGNVRCWGDNAFGQLGYGNVTRIGDNETPATAGDVNVGGVVVAIAAGEAHTCAILQNGAVRCWGYNQYGQLGYGNTTKIGDDEQPASAGDVNVGEPVTAISAGVTHTCAITISGNVRCWGDNMYGQLGYANTTSIGDTETPSVAGDVNLGGTAIAIAAGSAHTCALLATKRVRCWGDAMYGQLGYGNTARVGDNETPAAVGDVPLGGNATQIAVHEVHSCALIDTGAVRCWGDSMYGQLGYGNKTRIGDTEPASTPGDVPLGTTAKAITVGFAHTCVRTTADAVRCWGDGFYGQLGYGNTTVIGDTEPASTPGNAPIGGTITEISAGLDQTCARMSTGSVRCWGNGQYGKLGYANTNNVGDNEQPSSVGDVTY